MVHALFLIMNTRGNVLFLILIAVALFAALSYAVGQSGQSGGKTAKPETLQLKAGEVLQYLDLLKFSVMRAKFAGHHADYEFDFGNNVWGRYYVATPLVPGSYTTGTNGSCTSDSCKIFDPNGAGMSPKVFGYDILPGGSNYNYWPVGNAWNYPGHVLFQTASIMSIGSSEPELLAVIPYVSLEFCKAFNAQVGLTKEYGYGSPVDAPGAALGSYSGTLSSFPGTSAVFGDDEVDLAGESAFCIKDNAGGGRYIIYYALISR